MSNIKRDEIHLISKHSNWPEKSIQTVLKNNVYNTPTSWKKFLKLLFISLGIGFTTAGIIFFFAYNWDELHKFVKIGLMEGLVIATTSIVLFSKIKLNIKNSILTGATILVGVLFAVFGQVYQTGANAYDFFLGWTMAVTLWVIVSNFAPLWLVFWILINTTFILYYEQVANHWSEQYFSFLLFFTNSAFLIITLLIPLYFTQFKIPKWFSNTIAIASVYLSTFGIILEIFENKTITFWVFLVSTLFLYGAGIYYGLKNKSTFYISIISLSVILICSSFLIKISDGASMFFIVSLFVIGSVTFVIKILIDLQKKWSNE